MWADRPPQPCPPSRSSGGEVGVIRERSAHEPWSERRWHTWEHLTLPPRCRVSAARSDYLIASRSHPSTRLKSTRSAAGFVVEGTSMLAPATRATRPHRAGPRNLPSGRYSDPRDPPPLRAATSVRAFSRQWLNRPIAKDPKSTSAGERGVDGVHRRSRSVHATPRPGGMVRSRSTPGVEPQHHPPIRGPGSRVSPEDGKPDGGLALDLSQRVEKRRGEDLGPPESRRARGEGGGAARQQEHRNVGNDGSTASGCPRQRAHTGN
jgi:hypothetical protein